MQVGRDDGVEAFRILDHAHGHGIDQHLVPGHVRVVPGHLGGDLVPHHHAEPLGVGFRDHGQQLAGPRPGQFEGITHDPRDAGAGEDRNLGADLFGHALVGAAAIAGIFAFGVLAHDDPVEIPRADPRQRRGDARQDLGRAHVGILVEALADRQAQAPERHVVGHVGRAHRAEENGVEILDLVAPVLRHEGAGPLVAVRAPVEGGDVEGEASIAPGQRLKRLQPRRDHLGADAVGRDGGDPVGPHRIAFRLRTGGRGGRGIAVLQDHHAVSSS